MWKDSAMTKTNSFGNIKKALYEFFKKKELFKSVSLSTFNILHTNLGKL